MEKRGELELTRLKPNETEPNETQQKTNEPNKAQTEFDQTQQKTNLNATPVSLRQLVVLDELGP